MLFEFQKYISPIWCFHLKPDSDHAPYYVDVDTLSADEQQLIDCDDSYSSDTARKKDASYQALVCGIIRDDSEKELENAWKQPEKKPVDNYRFLRRFFSPYWSFYVLVFRLCTLHNPIREVASFWKTRKVTRTALCDSHARHSEYDSYDSSLVAKQPKVTVVIPTLNRYEYLKDAIHDLEAQTWRNFDLIVVDQTDDFQAEFYEQFELDMKVIKQEEKALWLARNRAIQSSDSNFFLLFDDDSRVDPNWIDDHMRCLDYFDVEISSGVSISAIGAPVPLSYSYFRWADQVDTGNVLIKREVFEKVGLFDRQFEKQRMGDGEFGLRAYLAGFRSVSNPLAKRLHLKVESGGLRQMGSWDGFRPKSWFAPRPIPSILYYFRRYFGNASAIWSILISVPPSFLPFRMKRSRAIFLLGLPLTAFILPFALFQVTRSWGLATRKIIDGPIVPKLEPKASGK